MKKITSSLIALMMIAGAASSMAAPAASTTVATAATATTSVTTDSVAVDTLNSQTAETAKEIVIEETSADEEIDFDNMTMDEAFSRGFDDGSKLDEKIINEHMDSVVWIIAIVFGFPALTIIAALYVIFAFALKRNRARNEIINNAIEHGYQLPDAFYNSSRSNANADGTPIRDSRKFYSAITLIACGISLIVFALCIDAPFFILCGGIPFLIGIGRLFGYFCIPANPNSSKQQREPWLTVTYQEDPNSPQTFQYPPRRPHQQPYQPPFEQHSCEQPGQTPPPYNPE